jgi:hypothetical protein
MRSFLLAAGAALLLGACSGGPGEPADGVTSTTAPLTTLAPIATTSTAGPTPTTTTTAAVPESPPTTVPSPRPTPALLAVGGLEEIVFDSFADAGGARDTLDFPARTFRGVGQTRETSDNEPTIDGEQGDQALRAGAHGNPESRLCTSHRY